MGEALIIPWTWEQKAEEARAHLQTVALCEERCRAIKAVGRHDEEGDLCDEFGTWDDYRLQAMSSAGFAVRIKRAAGDWEPTDPGLLTTWRVIPEKPEKLAPWAFSRERRAEGAQVLLMPPDAIGGERLRAPWDRSAPAPDPANSLLDLRLEEFMDRFTQREAEALILVEALGMRADRAAHIMRIREQGVYELLRTARKKFGSVIATAV